MFYFFAINIVWESLAYDLYEISFWIKYGIWNWCNLN